MIDTSLDPRFPSTRFWCSYHPLRFCDPLFFCKDVAIAGGFYLLSSSPPCATPHLAQDYCFAKTMRRLVSSQFSLAQIFNSPRRQNNTADRQRSSCFHFFSQQNFFSTQVKILFSGPASHPSSKFCEKKKEKNTDDRQCSFGFL